jgi:hypothetical protein
MWNSGDGKELLDDIDVWLRTPIQLDSAPELSSPPRRLERMGRREDPGAKYAAKRIATVARLTAGLGKERAEELVSAWEAEADARRLVRGEPPYWSDANGWFQIQLKPKPEGPPSGFEEIPLDLSIVPTVDEGLADAASRRKELSDMVSLALGGSVDGMLFRESLAFSSFVNRAIALHSGVVAAVRDANAHAAFTLLRAYNELVVLIYYLCDYPEYLDILERSPGRSQTCATSGASCSSTRPRRCRASVPSTRCSTRWRISDRPRCGIRSTSTIPTAAAPTSRPGRAGRTLTGTLALR